MNAVPLTERQALDAAIDTTAVLSPAEQRNLQRRLDRWELDHLRQLAKDQAEQIERLTNELHAAEDAAIMWQRLSMDRDDAEGPTAIGLTVEGELMVVPA